MFTWLTATHNNHLSETARYGYIPGLDGLRAIAVMIVMVAHLGFEHIVPGGFGVTVFFFISGFLITRLLLAESENKGIGLKDFYARRFVRLYPALLFMLFGTLVIYGLLGIGGATSAELAASIFYFTNFYQMLIRATTDTLPFMPWTHLWSLAVEEHFYLVFPAFMLLCRNNWKRAGIILIALIAVIPLWRTFIMYGTNLPYADYNYMMTDARLDSLAWGCLLSVLLHLKGNLKAFRPLLGVIPTLLAGCAIIASFLIRDEAFRFTLRFTLQGAALFVLILNFYYLRALNIAVNIAEWKWLAWIGKLSYALYLWHVPVYDLVHRFSDRSVLSLLITTCISFALAAFSFYIVEKPFMVLRKRFGAHIVKADSDDQTAKSNSPRPQLSPAE
ncbi:acyltransferase family protein [Hellea balneolensis]|uniref:acyltransferase family protein n=1 Tax=Hellea balneolensis TaxID=287478 RepID=UPI0003F9B968|nr:acyltransferase [Hellea balneolensis]